MSRSFLGRRLPAYLKLAMLSCDDKPVSLDRLKAFRLSLSFCPGKSQVARPALLVGAGKLRFQRKVFVIEPVFDLGLRFIRDGKLDRRRPGPTEDLHGVILAGFFALCDRHPRFEEVRIEHVLAVPRRLLPSLDEPTGEVVALEA